MSTDFLAGAMARRAAALCALREAGPVVEIDGVYHLTRRADVLAVLRDPEVFSGAWRLTDCGSCRR